VIVAENVITETVANKKLLRKDFQLNPNYPNPFNGSTTIKYYIAIDGEVSIKVYDILGKEINEIINDRHRAGSHYKTWNGTDLLGRDVSSGLYFLRINFSKDGKLFQSRSLKLLLVR